MILYLRVDSPKLNPETRLYIQAILLSKFSKKTMAKEERKQNKERLSQVGCWLQSCGDFLRLFPQEL